MRNLGPTDITVFGNKALFFDHDSDDDLGLWVTNGAASGTFELGGPKNSGIAGQFFSGLEPEDLTPAGNKVFFLASDTDTLSGRLWVTNGTTTVEIGGLKNAGISAGPDGATFSVDPNEMTSFGNDVIFTGGNSLWVSDGTASRTVDIANLFHIGSLAVFGTKVLFEAGASDLDAGLWITDGTATGTTEIGGLARTGIVGAVTGLWFPSNFTALGNKVLFTASDSGGSGDALWVTNGTATGTTEIGGLMNEGVSGALKLGSGLLWLPSNLVSIGTKALFVASDASGQQTLWVTDGTASANDTFEIGGVNNHEVTGAASRGPESGVTYGQRRHWLFLVSQFEPGPCASGRATGHSPAPMSWPPAQRGSCPIRET